MNGSRINQLFVSNNSYTYKIIKHRVNKTRNTEEIVENARYEWMKPKLPQDSQSTRMNIQSLSSLSQQLNGKLQANHGR